MKLNYKIIPANLAGAAVQGCGMIARDEVLPTLDSLAESLFWPKTLSEYSIGSTGKKDFSGDIDLVIDKTLWVKTPEDFYDYLKIKFGHTSVAKNGAMVHLKFPITSYKERECLGTRTGSVQVDFIFGDREWKKIFYFSAGDASAYKSSHRNTAISDILALIGKLDNDELDSFGRPVSIIRWKWSPDGLLKIRRTSRKDSRTGQWIKKQDDEIIGEPVKDLVSAVEIIFPGYKNIHALDSLETIIDAVKKTYDKDLQEKIWKKLAESFVIHKDMKYFSYPIEIQAYIEADDK